jgi:ribosomal protein S18 acetylase RimI-like enzyme
MNRDVPTRIERIRHHEIPAAAALVADAFLTDPGAHIEAVWNNDPETNRKRNIGLFRLLLSRAKTDTYVAKRDNEIVGCFSMAHSPHCHMGVWEQVRIALAMLLAVKASLPRVIKWGNTWQKKDPKERHWHLSPMCAKVELQGKGIGKRMMEEFCRVVDETGEGAYLETGKRENISFYQNFDFKVVGKVSVLAAPTWLMWREPVKRTS